MSIIFEEAIYLYLMVGKIEEILSQDTVFDDLNISNEEKTFSQRYQVGVFASNPDKIEKYFGHADYQNVLDICDYRQLMSFSKEEINSICTKIDKTLYAGGVAEFADWRLIYMSSGLDLNDQQVRDVYASILDEVRKNPFYFMDKCSFDELFHYFHMLILVEKYVGVFGDWKD